MKTKRSILVCGLLIITCALAGCDAFVRKFTRKPKDGSIKPIEQVLEPQEYIPPAAIEQYSQNLLYWQSWQDELINAFIYKSSQKKQLACAKEALKNLNNMRALLPAAKQKKLDVYIRDMENLNNDIERNAYSQNADNDARQAERLKRSILRDFSLKKVSGDFASGEKTNAPQNTEPGPAAN